MTDQEPRPAKPAVPARTLQGMRDFLPERMLLRQWVIRELRDVFERFGFEPLETPAVEYAETLKGKYGDEADKLIYQFEDRGGRTVGLRYDLTVPLARVVAQYPDLPRPFKRYQIAPVWRAERPQKGRYREFWQCDVDTVGTASMLADAEVIAVIAAVLARLGFATYTLRLNNRKILAALAESVGASGEAALALFRSLDKLDKIGPSGVRSELRERGLSDDVADRLFAFLDLGGSTGAVLAGLRDRFADYPLALEGVDELAQIVDALGASGVDPARFTVDCSMIRGLDYYTGPIVETVVDEPRIGSISGGGRYDGLIGLFSGRPVPATGVSVGLERIIDVIEELHLHPEGLGKTVTEVLVTIFAPETRTASLGLAAALRRAGVRTELSLTGDRLQNQLRYASRRTIPLVAIVGPDDLARDEVVVKDMASGEQSRVARSEIVDAVRARLASAGSGER